MKAKWIPPLFLVGTLLLALVAGLAPAQAQGPAPQGSRPHAAIVVNTLEDEFNTDGDCSLREAIAAANFNSPQDACPGGDSSLMDTITFASGGTIVLGLWLPDIQASGPLTIDGSGGITISGNHSVRPFYVEQGADLTLQNLAVVDGLATTDGGGAMYIEWAAGVTLTNCIFSGNHADDDGGAIYALSPMLLTSTGFYSNTADADGGAIRTSAGYKTTLQDCVLAYNAASYGGAIDTLGTWLVLQGCTVASNTALVGGAIEGADGAWMDVYQSHFIDNLAGWGGAIEFGPYTTLAIIGSDFTGNTATQSGGAINNWMASFALQDSTFYSNTATYGGALRNNGLFQYPTFHRIINTTFSENLASWGGAIYNYSATIGITNTTFAGNQATHHGDSLYDDVMDPGAIHLWNSIVAYGVNGSNCGGDGIVDEGHNIDSGTTCAFDPANGSIPNVDPFLGPLDNYGGPTYVHPLLQGSPAINHASTSVCPSIDQRGFPRRSGFCDVGAYEAQPYVLNMVQAGNNQSTLINTPFPIPLGVEAADEYYNPLGGVPITFEGPSNPGIANSGTTLVTGANGQVAFTALADGTPGGPYLVYGIDLDAGFYSPGFALTNLPYETATAITADTPDPSLAGQQFDVAFQVTSPYGTPTGYVGITVAGRPETCTAGLSGGVGSCSLGIATAGDYTPTATYYSADGTFGPSSATAPHTVNPLPPRDTVTTITADTPDPSQPSEIITVYFQVTAAGTPTGVVVVTVSGRPDACSSPLSDGVGSCQLSLVDAGDYTLVATYGGDADHDSSSDSEPHTVAAPGGEYAVFLPLIVRQ